VVNNGLNVKTSLKNKMELLHQHWLYILHKAAEKLDATYIDKYSTWNILWRDTYER